MIVSPVTCENVGFGEKHHKPTQVRLAFVPLAPHARCKVVPVNPAPAR